MTIETDYKGSTLELSLPVGFMDWYQAKEQEWPDGWRLPTRIELMGLFDEAIEADHHFRNNADTWSTTSYHIATTRAWCVDFYSGVCYAYAKNIACKIRLVREVRNET